MAAVRTRRQRPVLVGSTTVGTWCVSSVLRTLAQDVWPHMILSVWNVGSAEIADAEGASATRIATGRNRVRLFPNYVRK